VNRSSKEIFYANPPLLFQQAIFISASYKDAIAFKKKKLWSAAP